MWRQLLPAAWREPGWLLIRVIKEERAGKEHNSMGSLLCHDTLGDATWMEVIVTLESPHVW